MNVKLKARVLRASRRSRKLLALARHIQRREEQSKDLPGPPRCLVQRLEQPAAEGEQ